MFHTFVKEKNAPAENKTVILGPLRKVVRLPREPRLVRFDAFPGEQ